MSIQEFKCPNCGGPITFEPGIQEMLCPYCDSTLNVDALQYLDERLAEDQESEAMAWGYEGTSWQEGEAEGLVVYSCRSCGGEIVAEETLGATACPFCDNPVVLTSKFSSSLRPERVLPFQVTKEEAIAALKKHYLDKKLLPSVFKEENHLEEVKGVYVPFWLFDAEAEADMEYEGTKVRMWSDRNYRYTETSFFRSYRSGDIGFSAVPVDGSSAIDDRLTQSIEPFQVDQAVPFQMAYLSGFYANKYDVGEEEAEVVANQRIQNSTAKAFEDTVKGYQTVRPIRANIKLNRGGVEYVLLPMWLLSTRWQDKSFTFAMNGQTGKFVGDLPLDNKAYWSLFGKVFGISAGVLLAVSLTIIGLM